MRRILLYLILAAVILGGATACDLDMTGLERDLGCMVGSLDNHFPNERDPDC